MPARTNSGFGWTALFWSFALGVTAALAVAAAVFMFINNAPVPFVNKVDQSAVAVNEELLDGRLDPNKKLYAEGQGEVQQAAQPGAVAAVTADGKSATALPGSAAAQGTSEGETLDTHRYWVQAGAFSQSADAESMRARIALSGLTPRSATVTKADRGSTACAWGLLTPKRRLRKSARASPTTPFRVTSSNFRIKKTTFTGTKPT